MHSAALPYLLCSCVCVNGYLQDLIALQPLPEISREGAIVYGRTCLIRELTVKGALALTEMPGKMFAQGHQSTTHSCSVLSIALSVFVGVKDILVTWSGSCVAGQIPWFSSHWSPEKWKGDPAISRHIPLRKRICTMMLNSMMVFGRCCRQS